jgi:hypothetical protein
LSSFKHLRDDLKHTNNKLTESEQDIIIRNADNDGTIKVHNVRFRRFDNTGQNAVSHLIMDQRDLRTIRVKKQLFVECAQHICHLDPPCKDSGGLKCKGDCGYAIHDNLFFEDEKGKYHLEPPSIRDREIVTLVGLKFVKRYYRR